MDVRRGEIEKVILEFNCIDIDEIGDHTEAGTNCGACHEELESILTIVQNRN
jgi:NAD(P)H-nitrite reductase large subunit